MHYMDPCKGTCIVHTSEDGFIIRPSYMDINLSFVLYSVIGKLRNSAHQLEIKVGRYAQRRKNLPSVIMEWNLKNIMYVIVLFTKYEGDTIASLSKSLHRCTR